jgi:hypothetical protein
MNNGAAAKDDLLIHFERVLVSHGWGWITDLELGRCLIDNLALSGCFALAAPLLKRLPGGAETEAVRYAGQIAEHAWNRGICWVGPGPTPEGKAKEVAALKRVSGIVLES